MDKRIKGRVDVSCEYGFLDEFVKIIPSYNLYDENDDLKYFMIVKELFLKNSNLHVDFDPQEKIESNQFIRLLIKSGSVNFINMPGKESSPARYND